MTVATGQKVGISLTWEGKESGHRVYVQPRQLTKGERFGNNPDDNLIVEGDNLQALISLLPRFKRSVQIIYIDPPYNTGEKDFRYKDDWNDEGPGEWVGEDDGSRHTKWLKFMYPRLKILRRFLTQDGVIFVSIDDRELCRLGMLMDEIFGSQNKIGIFIWHSKRGGGSKSSHIVTEHEYIVCYARKASRCDFKMREVEAAELDCADEHGSYRLGRELNKWGASSSRKDRESMWFPIPGPNGEHVYPIRNDGSEGRWRWGKKKLLQAVQDGNIEFFLRENGTYVAYEKIRTKTSRAVPYRSILNHVGTYSHGTNGLKAIMGGNVFKNPKPVDLVQYLIELAGDDDCLVLDAFAGSGTTAHAVLQANNDDGGCRRFVLIENGNGDDKFCSTLTAERVRRVLTGEWSEVHAEPLNGGFTLKQVSSKAVDAPAILQMQREDLIDLIMNTDDLDGIQEVSDTKYIFGKSRSGRGIALVWNGHESGMSVDQYYEILDEAEVVGCTGPVRVYARSTAVGPDGDTWEFQKIPDRILARLRY